jgi:hypothetical protein
MDGMAEGWTDELEVEQLDNDLGRAIGKLWALIEEDEDAVRDNVSLRTPHVLEELAAKLRELLGGELEPEASS